CQDTGIAVYTCRVGEHFPLHPARIYEALKHGTERATVEHPLRSNAVHTITRENTGPNTGYRLPIVHWEFIPDWDGLDVKCGPMGLGGAVTVLQCHIEHADTHMTLNPVAVKYQCWAARRASAHISADGDTDFDREF